ncbi:MAG TPA: DUF1127 domain-containing protein [Burkholderiaceae bacterium]|nr:DUF1127 domain-containing protein [Burkholderiaceae bacterium]
MAANPTVGKATVSQPASSIPGLFTRAVKSVQETLVRWMHDYEMRRDLDRLDDHLLRDVGFDPRQARREAARPFPESRTLDRIWER